MNRFVAVCVATTCLSASLTSALAQTVATPSESAGAWRLNYASTVFPGCSTSRTATVSLQDDTGSAGDAFSDNPCGASLFASFSTSASGPPLVDPWLKNEFRMNGTAPSSDDVVVFTVDASGSGRVRRTLDSWYLVDLRLISTISGEATGTVVFQGPIESAPGTPQILMVASGSGTQTRTQTLLWPGTYELIVSGEAFRQGSVGSFITIIGAEIRFDERADVAIPTSGSRIVDVNGDNRLNYRDLGQWLESPSDLNGDGDIDAEDRDWLEFWLWRRSVRVDDCDRNGVPDRWQIEQNPTLDLDGDLLLDSCNEVVTWRIDPAIRYFRESNQASDRFGEGLDINAGRVYVGAPGAWSPTGAPPFRGAVYAFDIEDDGTTAELPTLFGTASFGNFGEAVWGEGVRVATNVAEEDFSGAGLGIFRLDAAGVGWSPELLLPGSSDFILDSDRFSRTEQEVLFGDDRYYLHLYTRSGSTWTFQRSILLGSRAAFNDPRTTGNWSRDPFRISLTSTLNRALQFSRQQSDLTPSNLPLGPGELIVGSDTVLMSASGQSTKSGTFVRLNTYSRTSLGNMVRDFTTGVSGRDAAIAYADGRYFVGDNLRDRVYVIRYPNAVGRAEVERILVPPASAGPVNGFGARVVSDGRYVAISAPDGGRLPSGEQVGGSVFLYDTQRVSVCEGDANGDGLINFADLNAALADFGMTGPDLPADFDGDGDVDFVDLNRVLSLFGTVCR